MSAMNANNKEALLRVDDLVMHFPIYRGVIQRQVGAVRAVDGVTSMSNAVRRLAW